MMKGMEEMLCMDWGKEGGILEEVGKELAEKLINGGMPFMLIHVEEDGEISFDGITEYDFSEFQMNVSYRAGTITDGMKGLKLDDVFYHDNFGTDGYLVYLKKDAGKSFWKQIGEEIDLSGFSCYLYAEKSVEEVMGLPAGSYLMIECGGIMRKMKEMTNRGNSHKGNRKQI